MADYPDGTRLTDFLSQTVGVYLQPEWTALQGVDKNFRLYNAALAFDAFAFANYTVPADKTLYICGLSFFLHAAAIADGDKPQIGYAGIYNATDALYLGDVGGNGGGAIAFPKPLVVEGGKVFRYWIFNEANHTCKAQVTVWGYEI